MELRNPSNGDEEIARGCSTPYVSASPSPGLVPTGHFFSAPASPTRFVIAGKPPESLATAGSFEFDGANHIASMISADELFFNGQIRPLRPPKLDPLTDLNEEDEDEARDREARLRSRSVHRRARSLSPMRRNPIFEADPGPDPDPKPSSSSRSSSSSKRWIFLKDLLYRSKSEGREKERFWHSISFSPSKPKVVAATSPRKSAAAAGNGVGKRTSAHERHYTANRAQAEEMRRRTSLPYRQGLFGYLGIGSRGYSAFRGLAKTMNPVPWR